jgi:hypothetical protein
MENVLIRIKQALSSFLIQFDITALPQEFLDSKLDLSSNLID